MTNSKTLIQLVLSINLFIFIFLVTHENAFVKKSDYNIYDTNFKIQTLKDHKISGQITSTYTYKTVNCLTLFYHTL